MKMRLKVGAIGMAMGVLGLGGIAQSMPAGAATSAYPVTASGMSLTCTPYESLGSFIYFYQISAARPTVSGSSRIQWKVDLFKLNANYQWYDAQSGQVENAGISNGGYTNAWTYQNSAGATVQVGNPARTSIIQSDENYMLVDTFYYWAGGTNWVHHTYYVQLAPNGQNCNIPAHWTQAN